MEIVHGISAPRSLVFGLQPWNTSNDSEVTVTNTSLSVPLLDLKSLAAALLRLRLLLFHSKSHSLFRLFVSPFADATGGHLNVFLQSSSINSGVVPCSAPRHHNSVARRRPRRLMCGDV